jgi:hypothetical protein
MISEIEEQNAVDTDDQLDAPCAYPREERDK